jgi:hypothetical protein
MDVIQVRIKIKNRKWGEYHLRFGLRKKTAVRGNCYLSVGAPLPRKVCVALGIIRDTIIGLAPLNKITAKGYHGKKELSRNSYLFDIRHGLFWARMSKIELLFST